MAPKIDVSGCMAKIERAAQHLETLDEQIRSFLDISTYGVEAYVNKETGWREMKVQVYAAPPVRLGVIVGDVVHNLRSALDHLVFELAGGKGSMTQFPIFTRAADYLEPRKDGTVAREVMLKGVLARDRAIIDQYQPYQRASSPERDPLSILNHLSNTDKHRIVPAAFAGLNRLGTIDISAVDPTEVIDRVETQWLIGPGHILEDNTPLFRFRTFPDPSISVKVNSQLPLAIGFGKTPKRIATTGTLGQMRGYVTEIIGRFS